VMAAVEAGELLPRRYESYRRLRRRYTDLVEARGPARRDRR
jgi:putative ribosome biogenesis GTPase RsgA